MKRLLLILIPMILLYGVQVDRGLLGNKMVVLSTEDHKVPMVDVCLVIKVGSGFDPVSKDGLANLCAKLLTYGTKKRSALQIAQEIEFIGSNLTTTCNEDYIMIRTKALSRYLDKVLELIADCAVNSQFNLTEIDRLKGEIVSTIKRQNDDPFALVDKTYRALLFKNHPYGHNPIGFDSTVTKIKRNDIIKFYNLTFNPDNAFLVVVGDFKKSELIKMVREHFGSWSATKSKTAADFLRNPAQPLEPIENPRGKIVNKDISQSYILLGHYGVSARDPDWLKVRVMNFILGGSGLTSRLALNIREEKGLAYIVYSWFERKVNPAAFIAEVQTKNESCELAVKQLLEEINKIGDHGALAKELEDAKNYYTGNFPLRYDSYSEKLNIIVEIELFNLGLDYFDRFAKEIEKIKLADINQMAKQFLFPSNYVLAIVGSVTAEDLNLPDCEWEE